MAKKDYSTLIGLISHYSPSGQERDAVDWLVERMHTLGYDQAFIDGAGNAVGILGSGAKQVVLLSHIDTVPGEIEIKQKSNLLYGRGAVDAKGPLACFIDAVAQVGTREGWQFVVIGAVEEERDSDGAHFVIGQYQPDFTIIGEPNRWDRIALGYKGSAWTEVTIKCKQSHTASGKKTAAESAVEAWLQIASYADDYNADKRKLFDKILLSLTDISSASNYFEQTAKMKIGVRLPVEITPQDWFAQLDKLLASLSNADHQVQPSNNPIPAWKGEKNSPLVRAFLKSIREHAGEPRFVYKTGTADINLVAPIWKCPAVVYGPGDSELDHTPDEHIDLDEYAKAVQVLSSALNNLIS